MARLEIRLLGETEVRRDGQVLTFPTQKVRELFVYLVLQHDRAHPRLVLANLLWPDADEEHGRVKLQAMISEMIPLAQELEHFQRAGELWASLGDGHRHAYALRTLAIIQLFVGEYAQAQQNLERALAEFQKAADLRGQATVLDNLGLIFCDLGQWARAQECYERAYTLMSEVGDRRSLGVILLNWGTLQNEQRRYTEALDYLDRVVSMLSEAGLKGLEVETLSEKGRAHLGLGELRLALDCSTRAMQVLEAQHGMISQAHRFYFIHYRILRANGRTDEAKAYLQRAYDEVCRVAGQIHEESLRKSFLENVPINREILQAWAQCAGG